jgi:hypothetical protein
MQYNFTTTHLLETDKVRFEIHAKLRLYLTKL